MALRPGLDFTVDWQCSLRQAEHDTEFDGIPRYVNRQLHSTLEAPANRLDPRESPDGRGPDTLRSMFPETNAMSTMMSHKSKFST